MLKKLKIILCILTLVYLAILTFFYYNQEKFYFNPKTLDSNYTYTFNNAFEELNIPVDSTTKLNSLLFKGKNSKGVILYLHGNAGAIHEWGLRSKLYTQYNYDILFVDYRGYGKNKNNIKSEDMLHNDIQQVYNYLKKSYHENNIVILGFSIGSGLAAKVAANNSPKLLILEAPYYSFESLVKRIAPFIPKFLINYKIPTYKFLQKVSCATVIFHGKEDRLIPAHENAVKLKKEIPHIDQLYLIDNCHHNGIYKTDFYSSTLGKILH